MPQLNKSSASRRSRVGDFLAVLLLLLIVGGAGWFWWQQKHPKKTTHRKPIAIAKTPAPVIVVPPVAKVIPPVKAIEPTPLPVLIPPVKIVITNTPAPTNPAPTPVVVKVNTAEFLHPAHDVFEAQIALIRRAISPGSIDGAIGSQTRAAIAAFQRSQKIVESSALDTNTRPLLTLDAPALTTYAVTTNDLARLQPIGKTWVEKSQQSALDYETILELVAEKAHAHPLQIQKLNPDVSWANVAAGTLLKIPDVAYPEPENKAAFVVIHLAQKYLEAFDTETNLILHCPCSIAAKVEKRPVGELHVIVVAPNPNYTVNPELFPESDELRALGHKLILPPGPNNPVGVAWIGLDKPGYGMHGTPVPEQVGRTESHGCFRLANWDAEYLVKLVWIGMPVNVVP